MLRLALFIVAALALTGGIVTEAQLGSGGSVLPVGADEAQADDDTVRPNVLLIMTDDQGWGDLRVHGNPDLDTPVLDALARESVRFDRFYVSSVCAPTRASLLTGRDHLRTGVQWVTGGLETMRPEEVTIAEVYRDAGYATGLFGKWHSGAHYPADPRGQGFETVFGFIAGHLNNYFDTDLLHSGERVETEGYITDVLTDAAIDFIEADRDRPFFAYVPYNAPHSPFQVPDAYFDKYVERGFDARMASIYGMVENIDTNVGRLLAALDATGQAEQTIVVFLTDNGPNGVRYNGGMRGTKASVHEGGVRVPLFIRYPNQLPADHVVRPLAAHIDLLPTLAELSDVPLPDSLDLDGRSLAPLMRDAVPSADWPERRLFSHHSQNRTLSPYPGAVRTSRFRAVRERDDAPWMLFDMVSDPSEQVDVSAAYPDTLAILVAAYDAWYSEAAEGLGAAPPIPVGYDAAPRVTLPPTEATFEGGLRYQGDGWANDWLTQWASSDDTVAWDLDVVQAGQFEIAIEYAVSPEDAGARLQVRAGDQILDAIVDRSFTPTQIPSPDRVERGEVYEQTWGTFVLGTMALPEGRVQLSLSAPDIPGAQALDLKAVHLSRLPE